MQGSIFVRPIEAKLYRDVELFHKMDPYCFLTLGSQSIKGTVCKKGGKRPFWDDIVVFQNTSDPVCVLELMDKDTLTSDDMIGICEIDLHEVEDEGKVLKWYELHYKRKLAGEILIETTFTREQDGPDSPLLYVNRQLVEKETMKDHNRAQKVAAKHIISYQERPARAVVVKEQKINTSGSSGRLWSLSNLDE